MGMRVLQLLPTISYGDGVSNDALAIDNILRENGYNTKIYAENIDERLQDKVNTIGSLSKLTDKDIVLYHLSTGTQLNYELEKLGGKKLVIYHNVTPPAWFAPYNHTLEDLCRDGLDGVQHLHSVAEYCLADSLYNKEELIQYGYTCDIDVLPILIPFQDYEKAPNRELIDKYKNDGYTNILFTGRIAPNKKQEDIIEAFSYYKKYYNKKARLFLVGSYGGLENYYLRLREYTERLGVEDVYFTGHISFDEILAYYHLADVFLCLSEHEGFCIPLVEAMYFDIPIVAYIGTGVADTLSGVGVGLCTKDPLEVAGVMNRLVTNNEWKKQVIAGQKMRLKNFGYETVSQSFLKHLTDFIER
ncbi:MAG: glycosyltransferase family 4 protein [Clostridiales bacterium]|nr:glycosyltransferase family 4 protein [Clostridiales bacterium]MCC8107012.1 glycosyltransferase family 4 protein [Clostridiales bacterium]